MRIRDLLLVAVTVGAVSYLVYDQWLRSLIEPVPGYVWELVGWSWFVWVGWYGLQRLSR